MKTPEEKLEEAKRILQAWQNKQRHDRCWYYPDLFRELCVVLEVTPTNDPDLPTIEEFQEGCTQFQADEYRIRR